jgi:hypothetical protein
MDALTSATNVLSETICSVEVSRRGIEENLAKAREMHERYEQKERSVNRHLAMKDKEEQRMHEERSRVKRLELHNKKQMQELERDRERMEKERAAYINEAKESAREARVARLESAQMCAQSKGDAQSEVESMKSYVLEQERLRIEAENQAREAKKKSSFLGDRVKILSEKLSATRKELKRYKGDQVKREDADWVPWLFGCTLMSSLIKATASETKMLCSGPARERVEKRPSWRTTAL